jgi:hypothetical protein
MIKLRRYWIAGLVWMACAAAAAPAAESQAILEVRVKDHREAIGDFSKLILAFEEISISPKADYRFWRSGWTGVKPTLASIDLTRYIGAHTATVFRGPVAAGPYDAIHLKIRSVEATLKKTGGRAQLKDTVGPIKLAFAARPASEVVIVIDLVVLDLSDHPPQAYVLAVGGYELYTDGKLKDKIPPG